MIGMHAVCGPDRSWCRGLYAIARATDKTVCAAADAGGDENVAALS